MAKYKNWQFVRETVNYPEVCALCRNSKTTGRVSIYRVWLRRWSNVPLCVPCWRGTRNQKYA